jgi:hypothetical protein
MKPSERLKAMRGVKGQQKTPALLEMRAEAELLYRRNEFGEGKKGDGRGDGCGRRGERGGVEVVETKDQRRHRTMEGVM